MRVRVDRFLLSQRISASGRSRQAVATDAGISRVTLWRILEGDTERPRLSSISPLAEVLGLELEEVIREAHQLSLFPELDLDRSRFAVPDEGLEEAMQELRRLPPELRGGRGGEVVAAMVDALLALRRRAGPASGEKQQGSAAA